MLGPPPPYAPSRCAAVHVSPQKLHFGDVMRATAGPPTADCGGPASTVHWTWPDKATAKQVGFSIKSGCGADDADCAVRVSYVPAQTQRDAWRLWGVSGTSAAGGWGSNDNYALLFGGKLAIFGFVGPDPQHGLKRETVKLKGHGLHKTAKSDKDGRFTFLVPKGSYTLSAKHKGKKTHFRYTLTTSDVNASLLFNLPSH